MSTLVNVARLPGRLFNGAQYLPQPHSRVSAGAGLQQALNSRSHKQEIMVFVSDLERLDNFLQAVDSLQQLGLSHVLLLSYSQETCEEIAPVVPDIGCAWSSQKHPENLEGDFYVWSLRYRTVAR